MTKLEAAKLLVKSLKLNPNWRVGSNLSVKLGDSGTSNYLSLHSNLIFIGILGSGVTYGSLYGILGGFLVKLQRRKLYKKLYAGNMPSVVDRDVITDILTGMEK